MLLEPKLRLRNTVQVQFAKLRDDQDRDLFDARNRRIQLSRQSMPTLFTGGFALLPQPDAKRVSVFEGEILMDVVTRSAPVRIDNLEALPTNVSTLGGDVSIEAVSKAADGWEVQLRLPPGRVGTVRDPGEATRLLAGDALRVLDQSNRPMRLGSPEVVGSDTVA